MSDNTEDMPEVQVDEDGTTELGGDYSFQETQIIMARAYGMKIVHIARNIGRHRHYVRTFLNRPDVIDVIRQLRQEQWSQLYGTVMNFSDTLVKRTQDLIQSEDGVDVAAGLKIMRQLMVDGLNAAGVEQMQALERELKKGVE